MKRIRIFFVLILISTSVIAAQHGSALTQVTLTNISDKCETTYVFGKTQHYYQSQDSRAANYMVPAPRVYTFYTGHDTKNLVPTLDLAVGATRQVPFNPQPTSPPISVWGVIASQKGPLQYMDLMMDPRASDTSKNYYIFTEYYTNTYNGVQVTFKYPYIVSQDNFNADTCQPAEIAKSN